MNLLGFVLAAAGALVLTEINPMFGVGIMSLILLGEALTHPENFNALSGYVTGSTITNPNTTESTGKKK